MSHGRLVGALAASLLCMVGAPAHVSAGVQPAVMVSDRSLTADGMDEVVITYLAAVSSDQVQRDADAIGHSTGWMMDSVEITSHLDPERAAEGPLYSARIMTSHTLDRGRGRLPIQQLVMAMKDYRRLLLVFDVPAPFQYLGHASYSDTNVDIVMEPRVPSAMTYAFDVNVKDPTFSTLKSPEEMDGESASRVLTPPHILAALALALLVGGASYFAILRITIRAEGSPVRDAN